MTEINASEVQKGDVIEGWNGYTIEKWEPHPSNPQIGRIHFVKRDRFGSIRCYTPKDANETVTVIDQ